MVLGGADENYGRRIPAQFRAQKPEWAIWPSLEIPTTLRRFRGLALEWVRNVVALGVVRDVQVMEVEADSLVLTIRRRCYEVRMEA